MTVGQPRYRRMYLHMHMFVYCTCAVCVCVNVEALCAHTHGLVRVHGYTVICVAMNSLLDNIMYCARAL